MRGIRFAGLALALISSGDRAGALKIAEQARALDPANETAPKVVDALKPK